MNKIIGKLKNLKHKEIIIAVIAVIVMLVIYFSSFGGGAKDNKIAVTHEDYCDRTRREIQSAVSKMDGAGEAEVVINWSSSVEVVTAQNTTVNGNSTTSQVVLSAGEPVIIKEIYPRAIGVLIVCEGGNDAKIKIDIIMAVATLMDISTDKVLVFGMSK